MSAVSAVHLASAIPPLTFLNLVTLPPSGIEAEGQEGEEDEERTDPEGKETSPLDTQEPARSPEPAEDVDKDAKLANDEGTPQEPPLEPAGVRLGQKHEILV